MRNGFHTTPTPRPLRPHRKTPWLLLASILAGGFLAGTVFAQPPEQTAQDETAVLQQNCEEATPRREPGPPQQIEMHRGPGPEPANGATYRLQEAGERARDLAEQLRRFQQQAEQTRREIARIEDQESRRARELREHLERTQRRILAAQQELDRLERDAAAHEKQRREEAMRRREIIEAHVRDLEQRQQELRRSLDAAERALEQVWERPPLRDVRIEQTPRLRDEPLRDPPPPQLRRRPASEDPQWAKIRQTVQALQEQIGSLQQQARRTQAALGKQGAERRSLMEQQEELRHQIRRMEEQLGALTKRAGTQATTHNRDMEQTRTQLKRMGQTIGRMEHEHLNAHHALRTDIQQVHQRVDELREELLRTQGTVDALLLQSRRSTVGSAGFRWGR